MKNKKICNIQEEPKNIVFKTLSSFFSVYSLYFIYVPFMDTYLIVKYTIL